MMSEPSQVAKQVMTPKRTLRLVAGSCLILGLGFLCLLLGLVPGYLKMQRWRGGPKVVSADGIEAIVRTARWSIVLAGLLSFLFLFFSVLLWNARKKIPE